MIKWKRDFAGSYTSDCGQYNISHNGAGAWNIGYRVDIHGTTVYEYHDACNTLACAKACTENTYGKSNTEGNTMSKAYQDWRKNERIQMETELFHKLKQCYHAALDLELDDLADAIDTAESELAKVITKHPELA